MRKTTPRYKSLEKNSIIASLYNCCGKLLLDSARFIIEELMTGSRLSFKILIQFLIKMPFVTGVQSKRRMSRAELRIGLSAFLITWSGELLKQRDRDTERRRIISCKVSHLSFVLGRCEGKEEEEREMAYVTVSL